MSGLAVDLIRDSAALVALELDWIGLWHMVPDANPFQHPAWLLSWWRVFGTGAARVATLRSGNMLAGILPLYELAEAGTILPFGAGITDYQDALLLPGLPRDAATMLLRAALAGAELPCHLTDLLPDAALRDAELPPGWTAQILRSDPCPVLLPARIPAMQRRKLRMAHHRVERQGGFARDDREPLALFEAIVALHTARWQCRGEAGALADPAVLAFHRAAIPSLAAASLLRIEGLRIDGQIAAVIYALARARRLFLYLSGFSPAHSFFSPGTLLMGEMVADAEEVHMLRGGERYKYAWGGEDRWNASRLLTPG